MFSTRGSEENSSPAAMAPPPGKPGHSVVIGFMGAVGIGIV